MRIMDLLTRPQGVSLPLAPLVAGAVAFAIAIVIGTLPTALFEGLVLATGLPAVLGAAEPPLGVTARVLLMVALAALMFAALNPLLSFHYGRRRLRVRGAAPRERVVRAPAPVPARPILAGDELGAPFLSVKAATPAAVVTETVEIADSVYITERRRFPREAAPTVPPPPAPARRSPAIDGTVSGLLERLEQAIASNGFSPHRPMQPGLRTAIHNLAGMRRAG